MEREPGSNKQFSNKNQNCSLSVCGLVDKTRTFSLKELQSMDVIEVTDSLLACGSGEPKGYIGQLRGVRLTDLINEVPVTISGHNDTKKMYLIVSSSDGYTTVFSWQEVFNTEVGEGIMVLLERDGQAVHGGSGEVDLFSAKDFLTGPRYLKKLAQIEICMVTI